MGCGPPLHPTLGYKYAFRQMIPMPIGIIRRTDVVLQGMGLFIPFSVDLADGFRP